MNFLKSIICVSVVMVLSACSDNESAQTYMAKAESSILEKQDNAAIILKIEMKTMQVILFEKYRNY